MHGRHGQIGMAAQPFNAAACRSAYVLGVAKIGFALAFAQVKVVAPDQVPARIEMGQLQKAGAKDAEPQ